MGLCEGYVIFLQRTLILSFAVEFSVTNVFNGLHAACLVMQFKEVFSDEFIRVSKTYFPHLLVEKKIKKN